MAADDPHIILQMSDSRKQKIAIDGPAGAGKSSAGRALAKRLGYRFLDTGQMYRAITLAALDAGVRLDDPDGLAELARKSEIAVESDASGDTRIRLDGRDVTARLTAAEVERGVSAVSAVRGVRVVLVGKQRQVADGGAIVLAGRDIGTVVLKDADFKFYLEASAGTRGARRHRELVARGRTDSLEEVVQAIRLRDELDSSRAESPLSVAADAVVLVTDSLELQQVVDRMAESVLAGT